MSLCVAGLVYFEWVIPAPEALPSNGEEAFVSFSNVRLGGAWHVVAAAKNLGLDPVLVYPAGTGLTDVAIGHTLAKEGIKSSVCASENDPAISAILIKQGERSFLSHGQHGALINAELPEDCEWIHVPGLPEARCLETQINEALKRGQKISLSGSWFPELLKDFKKLSFFSRGQKIDLLTMNEKEALCATGASQGEQALERLIPYARNIVITLGDKGSLARWEDATESKYRQWLAPTNDPTGAGDSFAAGLLAAIIQNKNPEERLSMAAQSAYNYLLKERK